MFQYLKASQIFIFLFFYVGLHNVNAQENSGQEKGNNLQKSTNLTIHLRGVYESKISLLPLTGPQALKPILEKDGVMDGSVAVLNVPKENLPGEFVLRFDYKEEASSTPYPSEKRMIINDQDLELWVRPVYCNNSDSTWYQEGERENSAFEAFMAENAEQKKMIGLLQDFLIHYDETDSKFYKEGITEYEKRRKAHNNWISDQIENSSDLFVSRKYGFQFVPEIDWKGSETDRKQSLRDHYFDQIDFSDPIIVKTSDFNEWMNSYVNLYGELATTEALRDSLFALAGQRAIEEAKMGHPEIYGWMVDYFFNGYETNNIQAGTAMLEPYLNDPNCLTSKRQAILKRLEGMETLVPGVMAPDFTITDKTGKKISFLNYQVDKPYKLVLFWGADCAHCRELVDKLYPWYQKAENKEKLDVFAISTDDTEEESKAWDHVIKNMTDWIHIPTKGGVNSKEANDYYILATPVMILVDAKTSAIVALPENINKLSSAMK